MLFSYRLSTKPSKTQSCSASIGASIEASIGHPLDFHWTSIGTDLPPRIRGGKEIVIVECGVCFAQMLRHHTGWQCARKVEDWTPAGEPTGNVLFHAKLLASCHLPYGRSEQPEPSQKLLPPRAGLRYLEPSAQPSAADGEGLCSMLGGGGRQET